MYCLFDCLIDYVNVFVLVRINWFFCVWSDDFFDYVFLMYGWVGIC